MICQICGEREATIVLKRIFNGVQSEIHMCEACAKKELMDVASKFNFGDVFSMFLPGGNEKSAPSPVKTAPMEASGTGSGVCPNCGTPFELLNSLGLVGCEKCYETFADSLRGYITRLHGKSVHTGKIARGASVNQDNLRELSNLRAQLEAAIADEKYELAAEYRDLIKKMQKEAEEGNNER